MCFRVNAKLFLPLAEFLRFAVPVRSVFGLSLTHTQSELMGQQRSPSGPVLMISVFDGCVQLMKYSVPLNLEAAFPRIYVGHKVILAILWNV